MPQITLELILHQDTGTGTPVTKTLNIVNHVHERVERFIYTNRVYDEGAPLVYLENELLDSRANLQIANRTYTVPGNSVDKINDPSHWDKFVGLNYTSQYDFGLITNKTAIDREGGVRPLFYLHDLPDNTVNCEIYSVQDGNKISADVGFEIDLDAGKIFTNYRNQFDADSDSYKLYFVSCAASDGTVDNGLLNPVPVAREADWQDIDLTTGQLNTGYPLYQKATSTSGTTFFMNSSDTWFFKPTGKSLVQPLQPIGTEPDDPWYLRVSNGCFSAVTNSATRSYRIPEFTTQPFIPSFPTVFSPYNRLLKVNRNVVAATRGNLSIKPTEGLHLEIQIYSFNGELIRVLSTDSSLSATRFSTTSVFYETDKISSWDNEGGFIALGIDIHSSWELKAKYSYEATDYEYKLVSLNPLNHRRMRDHTIVYYVIPDVNDLDKAMHHLVVDEDGFIVDVSQGPDGIVYPNLQLRDEVGAYNATTVIGLKYVSTILSDTFTTRYTVGEANSNAYMILAECAYRDIALREDQFDADVRTVGAVPLATEYANVIRANPRILQSRLGYGEDGMEIPQNSVMVIEADITILEAFGGSLTEAEADVLLKSHMPASGLAVIEYVHPKTVLSASNLLAGQITISWTWEGPSQTYKLYRQDSVIGTATVIDTQVSPAEGTISFIDTTVLSDEVHYYYVTITENGVEFPSSDILSARIR